MLRFSEFSPGEHSTVIYRVLSESIRTSNSTLGTSCKIKQNILRTKQLRGNAKVILKDFWLWPCGAPQQIPSACFTKHYKTTMFYTRTFTFIWCLRLEDIFLLRRKNTHNVIVIDINDSVYTNICTNTYGIWRIMFEASLSLEELNLKNLNIWIRPGLLTPTCWCLFGFKPCTKTQCSFSKYWNVKTDDRRDMWKLSLVVIYQEKLLTVWLTQTGKQDTGQNRTGIPLFSLSGIMAPLRGNPTLAPGSVVSLDWGKNPLV